MAIVLLISQIIALKQLHQAVLQVLLQLAHALKAILLQVSVLLLAQLKHPLQLAPPAFALVFSNPLVRQIQQIAVGLVTLALFLQLLLIAQQSLQLVVLQILNASQ